MPEPVTMGELTRWLQAIERRMGDMHGENRAGIAKMESHVDARLGKIESSVGEIAKLQREQNGRVSRVEMDIAVLKTQQRSTDEEIEAIKGAASEAAAGAASQAIHDTAPGQKRATVIAAVAAGATGGGIIGAYKVVELIVNLMK